MIMMILKKDTCAFLLTVLLVGSFFCGLTEVSCSQFSAAEEDTVQVLRKEIRSLEGRIQTLEAKLEEAFKTKTVEEEASLISSLQSQLASLSEEMESLKLALEIQQERLARVKVSGEERIRFMNIDTQGARAIGAYGEELKQETTLKHYLRLETRVSVSENLSAGARLRLTNVSQSVLDDGPEYLSQEWGSVFLRFARKEFNCTIGAYDIHFTPFTLMRWDQEDNPEGGGEAGGGCLPCGGIAGAIPSESLEELSPRLSFEGARLNGMVRDYADVIAFYARPQHAGRGQYRQHIFGLRAKFLGYHRPSTSFRHLGLTVMTVRDEATSILLPAPDPPPALENNILGLDFNFPLSEGFLFRGEWTYTAVKLDSVAGGQDDYDGHGFLFGFKSQYPENLKLRCSYVRLDRDFESAYRAVSYASNREGIRSSMTLEIPQWKSSISAFAKALKVIEKTDREKIDPDEDPILLKEKLTETSYTASLGLSVTPIKNVLIRPSLIYRGQRGDEKGIVRKVKDDTFLFIHEVILTLFKDNEFILRYQYIDSSDNVNPSLDYTAESIFSLFSLKF